MILARWIAGALLAAAITAGTLAQRPVIHPPISLGGYQVLAADFHIHVFPMNWTTLAPWDAVLEAQRHGLDVAAVIGHNHLWVSQAARWFSQKLGGPEILPGEEIVTPTYHLIGLGLHTSVGWRQSAAEAVAAVHQQGGVAIAAHPEALYWPGWDTAAMRDLDASEVVHPDAYRSAEKYAQLREFYERKPLTAIGSSDFHGNGHPGSSRTYVFVRESTESGILQALRERHTVVYDRDGRAYGDPELIRLAAEDGRLPVSDPNSAPAGFLGKFSWIAGVLGLLVALFFGLWHDGLP
jgi:hypothetical protein